MKTFCGSLMVCQLCDMPCSNIDVVIDSEVFCLHLVQSRKTLHCSKSTGTELVGCMEYWQDWQLQLNARLRMTK